MKILDILIRVSMIFFSALFTLIGFYSLICLFADGDAMNLLGVASFIVAWICWEMRI